MFTKRSYYFLICFFLSALFFGGHAFALSVDQLRIGAHPGKTRLVLDLSAKADFRIFLLADPYRLVIDLPDFEWRAGEMHPGAFTSVRALRHGPLENGISRIVMELDKPSAIGSAFLLPKGQGMPDRLVIDIAPSTDAQFHKNLDKAYGALGGNEVPPPEPQTFKSATRSISKNPAPPVPPVKPAGKKPLIIIDPGHGGPDSGTIGVNGLKEKNVTLAVAKTLKSQLEDSGKYRVLLTRETDFFIPLRERVQFARDRGGDLFISIHADSIEKGGVQGASIYTLSEKASDAESAKLAAKENKADLIGGIDLSTEDKEVADILVDITMRDTMNQSRFFAGKLANIFPGQGLRILEKPTRSAGFAVLKAPDIPSILVETGYLSNRKEAALLNTPAHREKIATALKKGVDAYFEQVRMNQRI